MKKPIEVIKNKRLTGVSTPFFGLSWENKGKNLKSDSEDNIQIDYKIHPEDFMFQMTKEEVNDLRSKISTANLNPKSRSLSHVFTEYECQLKDNQAVYQ